MSEVQTTHLDYWPQHGRIQGHPIHKEHLYFLRSFENIHSVCTAFCPHPPTSTTTLTPSCIPWEKKCQFAFPHVFLFKHDKKKKRLVEMIYFVCPSEHYIFLLSPLMITHLTAKRPVPTFKSFLQNLLLPGLPKKLQVSGLVCLLMTELALLAEGRSQVGTRLGLLVPESTAEWNEPQSTHCRTQGTDTK